jgi:hypothetical protein
VNPVDDCHKHEFPSIHRGDRAEARHLLVPRPATARSGAFEPNDVAATDCPSRALPTTTSTGTEHRLAEPAF